MAVRRIRLARLDSLPAGEHRVLWAEGNPILVINLNGEVFAFQGTCSHEQYSLQQAWIEDGRITCPAHLSTFDIRSGGVLEPPADLPLMRYPVVLESGEVYLEIDGPILRNE